MIFFVYQLVFLLGDILVFVVTTGKNGTKELIINIYLYVTSI